MSVIWLALMDEEAEWIEDLLIDVHLDDPEDEVTNNLLARLRREIKRGK